MLLVEFEYPVEIVKAYEESGRFIVEGYAATSDFDMQEDIITEEAIRASAKDLIENSTVLHNHNPDEAIGRVLESKARPGGLYLKILISKTAPDIWQQVKEGVLNKFSVRGKILEARKEWVPSLNKHARLILKMRLVEVSLVAVPANPKAKAIRWYVEKALSEFEKSGGDIGEKSSTEGGFEMDEDVIIEEELLEASGEPDTAGKPAVKNGKPADGDPDAPPKKINKQEGEPGTQPDVQRGARMAQIIALVAKLLAVVEDENQKKLLTQIRTIASGAANIGPLPKKGEPSDSGPGDSDAEPDAPPSTPAAAEGEAEVEKAGRKISSARIARLKKLLDELKGFIEEVDASAAAQGDKKSGDDTGASDELKKTVEKLTKRLDALEGTPGARTSLDGQENLAGEQDTKSIWKGMV
jgi:HK97 family phage prohead protease